MWSDKPADNAIYGLSPALLPCCKFSSEVLFSYKLRLHPLCNLSFFVPAYRSYWFVYKPSFMLKACCCEGVAQQCFMFSFIQNPEVVTSSSGFVFWSLKTLPRSNKKAFSK
jgi:hypothetical protein